GRVLHGCASKHLLEQKVITVFLVVGRADHRNGARVEEQREVCFGLGRHAGLHTGKRTPSSTSSKSTTTSIPSAIASFSTSSRFPIMSSPSTISCTPR